jgi:hypothetical protein
LVQQQQQQAQQEIPIHPPNQEIDLNIPSLALSQNLNDPPIEEESMEVIIQQSVAENQHMEWDLNHEEGNQPEMVEEHMEQPAHHEQAPVLPVPEPEPMVPVFDI